MDSLTIQPYNPNSKLGLYRPPQNELRLYEPHSNQQLIHASKAKYRTVVAGRRFGKSALAINECLARCFQLKKQICWIILPLLKQAKEIYWIDPDVTRYFMPYVTSGLVEINNSDLSLRVKSTDSWIRLKGSDNFDSLRGAGLDLVVWDEFDDVKPLAIETIKPALADSPNHRQLFIGTPKGQQQLHENALRGDHDSIIPTYDREIALHPDWETWWFTSYDNTAWAEGTKRRKAFVAYIDNERKVAEERGDLTFFNQEYMASFDQSAGAVFKEFSKKSHTIKPVVPNPRFDHYLSIDWGYSEKSAFSAHLHALIPMQTADGQRFLRVITYKEWYGNQKPPHIWAEEIFEDCKKMGISPIGGVVDGAILSKMQDGNTGIGKRMTDRWDQLNGGPWIILRPGSKKRDSRVGITHDWLSRPHPDDLPYWLITDDCPNLIRTLPTLTYNETKLEHGVEDVDTTQEDHAWDDSSYFLSRVKFITVQIGAHTYSRKPMALKPVYNDDGEELGLDAKIFAQQYA